MWIISKEFGAFNADKLSAIQPPDPGSDWALVFAYDSGRGFRITHGYDSYRKILAAIANNDSFVEVP